jgi:GR25 family glycosyltransferase involved in LPS biosynthesis
VVNKINMFNIDTYLISLKHRSDRRDESMKEIERININPELVHIIDAQLSSRNGVIGAASTHAYALSHFLHYSDGEYCLIFEDDFSVSDPEHLQDKITPLLKHPIEWDVLLLASNVAVPVERTRHQDVFKVIHAQTCSGYLVTRKYTPTLIKTFFESAYHVSYNYKRFPVRTSNHFYAFDMMWKPLQIEAHFYAFLPQLVKQRASYSEIENKFVSYGV